MRTLRNVVRPAWDILGSYVVTWTFGNVLGAIFWLLVALRIIRIRGYKNAMRAVRHGGVIIAANHPSLLETFLIPLVFWPRFLFNHRFYVWSAPDIALFPTGLKWLYVLLHCVTLDRTNPRQSVAGVKQITELLQAGRTIVIHPEGGRTIKGDDFRRFGGRKVRRIRTLVPKIAERVGAHIMPAYVWMRRVDRPLSFWDGIVRLFRRDRTPIVISFARTYRVRSPMQLNVENEKLEKKILSA